MRRLRSRRKKMLSSAKVATDAAVGSASAQRPSASKRQSRLGSRSESRASNQSNASSASNSRHSQDSSRNSLTRLSVSSGSGSSQTQQDRHRQNRKQHKHAQQDDNNNNSNCLEAPNNNNNDHIVEMLQEGTARKRSKKTQGELLDIIEVSKRRRLSADSANSLQSFIKWAFSHAPVPSKPCKPQAEVDSNVESCEAKLLADKDGAEDWRLQRVDHQDDHHDNSQQDIDIDERRRQAAAAASLAEFKSTFKVGGASNASAASKRAAVHKVDFLASIVDKLHQRRVSSSNQTSAASQKLMDSNENDAELETFKDDDDDDDDDEDDKDNEPTDYQDKSLRANISSLSNLHSVQTGGPASQRRLATASNGRHFRGASTEHPAVSSDSSDTPTNLSTARTTNQMTIYLRQLEEQQRQLAASGATSLASPDASRPLAGRHATSQHHNTHSSSLRHHNNNHHHHNLNQQQQQQQQQPEQDASQLLLAAAIHRTLLNCMQQQQAADDGELAALPKAPVSAPAGHLRSQQASGNGLLGALPAARHSAAGLSRHAQAAAALSALSGAASSSSSLRHQQMMSTSSGQHQTKSSASFVGAGLSAGIGAGAGNGIDFECDTCGSSFDDRHRLMQHQSIHLELKKEWFSETPVDEVMKFFNRRRGEFYCEPCNLRFEATYDYDRHNNTVHGPRPYRCQFCGNGTRTFVAFRSMLNHLYDHRYVFRCRLDSCDFTVNRRDSLRFHIFRFHLNCQLPQSR